jgi:hypothetical protein
MAENFSGVYSYSKGLNKASATMYLTHFSSDSAFLIIQSVSGMPDFLTSEVKGFVRIDQQHGTFYQKDSCSILLEWKGNACILTEHQSCDFDFSYNGIYKKTLSKVSKTSAYLPSFADKLAVVISDSAKAYAIPHASGNFILSIAKDKQLTLLDEYNNFYLIELSAKKKEFLWIPKHQVKLLKQKR